MELFESIFGVLLAMAVGRIAFLCGRFWMHWSRLHEPIYCSAAFLDDRARWLTFYLPIAVLPLLSGWMLHSALAATAVFVVVAFEFWRGTRRAYSQSLQRAIDGFVEGGKSLADATFLAKREMDAILSVSTLH